MGSKADRDAAKVLRDMHGTGNLGWTPEELKQVNLEHREGEGMAYPCCRCQGKTMHQANTQAQRDSVNAARATKATTRKANATAAGNQFRNSTTDKEITDVFVCSCWYANCGLASDGGNCPVCIDNGSVQKQHPTRRGMWICACVRCACSCGLSCTRQQYAGLAASAVVARQRENRKSNEPARTPMTLGGILDNIIMIDEDEVSSPPSKRLKTAAGACGGSGDSGVFSAYNGRTAPSGLACGDGTTSPPRHPGCTDGDFLPANISEEDLFKTIEQVPLR